MSEQPVVVVTGAAGGIGSAMARIFSDRGYRLSLVDRDTEKLNALRDELSAAGENLLTQDGDLANLEFCEALIQKTTTRFGRLDLLVNNAAAHDFTTMRSVTVEEWDRILRVNLTVPAFLARWAAAEMEKTGGGVIVNISSIEAVHPTALCPAYVAAKGALDSLTYSLSNLYGPAGIRVVGVRPGAIDTALSQDYVDSDGESLTDDLRSESEGRIPLRRWGQPEEIARLVAWLASDEASYITGTSIDADGGWIRNRASYTLQRRMKPDEIR